MFKYTCICLKDGIKCYEMIKVLTIDELANQKVFWGVNSNSQLLQRWNQQIESPITKLKWVYY